VAERISDNVAMLMRVVDRLAPLRDRLVFLGGAVTDLFITAPGRRSSRHTKDVDVVINVVNLGEYSDTLREQLVELGLREDVREGAPVCRWLLDDFIVDIMPTRGDILGLSCEWYQLAFDTARPISLPNGVTIRLVTPACFLATKLNAFADRGRRNPMASHDLEDVIAVIDGRPASPRRRESGPTPARARADRGDGSTRMTAYTLTDLHSWP
jgi:predicted nucleotidyltransferase